MADQIQTPPAVPVIDEARLQAELKAARDETIKATREAATAEAKRCNAIRAVCTDPKLTAEIDHNGAKVKVNILEHALEAGWTAEATELCVLRASREKPIVNGGLGYSVSTPEVNGPVIEVMHEAEIVQRADEGFRFVHGADLHGKQCFQRLGHVSGPRSQQAGPSERARP